MFDGALSLYQPARGYRVNVDTLLLAAFAAAARPRARRVVDLGSGVGALGLAYAFLAAAARLDFVERDSSLSDLAKRNLAESKIAGAVHVADLDRSGLPGELAGAAEVVLSNPPFFDARASRRSTTDGVGGASRVGPLAPFLHAASRALGRRGAAFFAYPAPSLAEFLVGASGASLVAKRLRLVHAFANSPARLALVELRRAKPGGLVVVPPLVEWAARGVRSSELEALVAGRRRANADRP